MGRRRPRNDAPGSPQPAVNKELLVNSTRSKILILCVFALLVSILITIKVIFHESLRADLSTLFNQQQVFIAKGIANSMETAIEREVLRARFIGSLLGQLEENNDKLNKKIIENLIQSSKNIPSFMTIYKKKKEILYSTAPKNRHTLYASILDVVDTEKISPIHDAESIYIFEKIQRGSSAQGWILTEIPIKHLTAQFLTPFKSMERGYAWLMDGEGYLLSHPTEPGMIANNLYHAEKKCFQCHTSFDLEKKVLSDPTIEAGRTISPTREDKILAFARFRMGNEIWIVCVTSPYTEVISITERSMRIYSWLVAAIFSTVFFGASVIVVMNEKRLKAAHAANEEVLLEKRKLDTIVSAINCGLLLVDTNHKILWANETMHQWAGDILGKDCVIINSDCCTKIQTDEVAHEIVKGLFDKPLNIYQITTAWVKNSDGVLIGELKLIQDVTEIRRMEERILHSEKLTALGRLAAGVAHEILNPLTAISSFVQIVMKQSREDFTRENLATILQNIERIADIVSQMSQFSKLPSLRIAPHSLKGIVDDAINITRYDKKMQRITVLNETSEDLPPVAVDRDCLLQVFINLLFNAADACHNQTGSVTIHTRMENVMVVIDVTDNGCGIADKDLNKIFDPFFTTKEKGTGLGLPISFEIIKKMYGDLRVRSHQGDGTVFTIVLPMGGNDHA